MTFSHRLLCTGFLVVTFATGSRAQVPSTTAGLPSEKTIANWLHSGKPRLVAWGAHDALIARDPNLITDLLSLAGQWQPLSRQAGDASNHPELSREQMNERDAMAAVLDTLIQMNVAVPPDTLRNLAPDFGNDVAILLSRMPPGESVPLAFDLYHLQAPHTYATYALQYVSAALLALHPPAGFAADLLTNTTVHAEIFVVVPGSGTFGGGSASCCGGGSTDRRPERWPLTGQYALSREQSDGALLLVGGIDPIYATREQSTHYLGDLCHMSRGLYMGAAQRLGLIAEMLGIPSEAIPWQTDPTTQIEFRSLPQFNNALLSFVAEQQEKYRTTAAALADKGLLTPSEAQEALPKLELKLSDMRGQNARPIPHLSNLPSQVEWSSSPF